MQVTTIMRVTRLLCQLSEGSGNTPTSFLEGRTEPIVGGRPRQEHRVLVIERMPRQAVDQQRIDILSGLTVYETNIGSLWGK